jgi:dipeptidyl-peptidase-4
MKKELKRLSLVGLALILVSISSLSQPKKEPLTVAEASEFTATSRYADVVEFIRHLQRQSSMIRVETLCQSAEGRAVPLLVIGNPTPASPLDLHRLGKAAVYIQANIHAGEVEGKEASLMLARDILLSEKPPYLDKLVILIAPIFNADGNEKISPENRRNQVGPEKGVGVRYNGQNLDLNRDSMKLESPELRGLVQNVLIRWDPVLLVDCHTTNGSYHEEPVTYSWPLNPNGDSSIIQYMRDRMLPSIKENLVEKYATLSIPYGNFMDFNDPEKGWRTASHLPRLLFNYMGLRNRLAILDENYAYADYKTRVLACYNFLRSILEYCTDHEEEIVQLVAEADRKTTERGLSPSGEDTFAVEIDIKSLKEKIAIQGWEMEVIPREEGWPRIKKTEKKRTYKLPYFAQFVPKRSIPLPYAYLIPLSDSTITDILLAHGLTVEKLTESAMLEVESFRVGEIKGASRLYQGHYLNEVKGEYKAEEREFPPGTLFISTAQPLGRLTSYLLEAESDDGLLVWNFFDRYLVPQWGRQLQVYPVYRLRKPANLAKEKVD